MFITSWFSKTTWAIVIFYSMSSTFCFGMRFWRTQQKTTMETIEESTINESINSIQEEPAYITYKDVVYYTLNLGEGFLSESSIEEWLSKAGLKKVHAERYIWDLDFGGNSPAINYCWGKGISYKDWEMSPTENEYFGVKFILFFDSEEFKESGFITSLTIITSSETWYKKFMDAAFSTGFKYSNDLDKETYGKEGKRYTDIPLNGDDEEEPSFIIDDFSVSGKYCIEFANCTRPDI